MEWNRFDTRGKDASAAFEALTAQLFERFCRRAYGGALRQVRVPDGAGGDGGVDAVARLASKEEIGLQAKWFRNAFGRDQIRQVEDSLRTAITKHPRLVRYFVAIPRNLTETQRRQWDAWVAKAKTLAPRTEIELWDEARLHDLLSEKENEGLDAYWFTGSQITLGDLEKRFEGEREGWLRPRYFPALHAPGALEQDLALRLGDPDARAALRREVRAATDEVARVHEDVVRLANYPVFMRDVTDATALREAALGALQKILDAGKKLALALRRGRRVRGKIPFGPPDKDALRRLENALEAIKPSAGSFSAPTHDIRERLHASLWENRAPEPIADAWYRWKRSGKIAAFVGPPGIGKTHGLADVVRARLKKEQPALLLRAKDCPLQDGWAGILRKALDQPTSTLEALLNALEALAVRADFQRARRKKRGGVDGEPTCFLLAIDGLEESGHHARWAELLGMLSGELKQHPRIRVAVTLRTSSVEAILGRVNRRVFDAVRLPRDGGDVQKLLKKYCAHYKVRLPDRRLCWAIRDPLSVRLYCKLLQESWPLGARRQDLSLPSLLRAKIEHAEEALREKGRYSPREAPLHTALSTITQAYVQHGPLPREDAIKALEPSGLLPREKWSWLFDQAEEHGIILVSTEDAEELGAPRVSYVEPAFDPLTDFLIAEAATEEIRVALKRGERPKLGEPLKSRPDALIQAAILLAQEEVRLVDSGVWKDELSTEEIEILQLGAVAALDDEAARPYAEWVRGRLVASMPSCRRVLAELCVPVARDEAHPFGPRFVHEALLPYLPAKRDLFWSGPSYLPGNGERPWEGEGIPALERLTIERDDRADGPPLLLGWALTSVDSRWRRRLRAELAKWGAGNLDDLVRWLDLTLATNDPQMAEDAAMVAHGAACLAGEDPKLGALAAWVDANLLAPGARRRREDLVVLHAARGVVERARLMGAAVEPAALEHAKQLYSVTPETLPIDAKASKEADDHYGASPITGDLAWYVVPGAIEPFFYLEPWEQHQRIDPRAGRVLATHARAAQLDELTPQKFAFGVVAAHLDAMGWTSDDADHMDLAIGKHYPQKTHGERSLVGTLAEKYVWTGCFLIQAYLASRAPAQVDDAPEMPPVDPVLVSNDLTPNPASDVRKGAPVEGVSWSFWADDRLVASSDLKAKIQNEMADEWVRRAPRPELRPWLQLPRKAAPPWSPDKDWIVLSCVVIATERQSQADSLLKIASFAASEGSADALKHDARLLPTQTIRDLSKLSERVRCDLYADPFDACWAPWATGVGGLDRLKPGKCNEIDVQAASAKLTWEAETGERSMLLPAHWLRTALAIAGAVRRASADGEEWHFVDRCGDVHAFYSRTRVGKGHREALLIRRSSLDKALDGRRQVLAWAAWLFREPNPSLYDRARKKRPEERNYEWFAFLTPRGVDVLELPPFSSDGDTLPPEKPSKKEEPPPLVPVGPINPGLATELATELDDDNAIPYFLWDDPMTVRELRHTLATASPPERDRLLGKILREARDPDVWRFTTPDEVATRFDALARHLGRRRAFWRFLLDHWEKEGLLVKKSA